jgi:eukaryotic-like serine/threonine-protein kinase
MLVTCPLCSRSLDFSGEPPRFCSYCGQPLGQSASVAVPLVSLSEAPTLAPTPRPDTGRLDPDATLPPDAPGAALVTDDPKSIGGYKLLRILGSGGMGTVYEAENAVTGQRVALKLISRSYAANPEVVRRFQQEGKLASKIAHPRCVFILAADEEQGRPYIVMELMPGPTLGDYVRAKGPLPVPEAVTKIMDVIDGLAEVHRLGLVHRDMKPSNCFLDNNGRVKVADFGLAKALAQPNLGESSAHLTKTGSFLGTPLYAAPEQVKGEKVDQQADIYAVAATLYFTLAGKAPFEGAGDPMAILAQIVSDDPKPLSDLRPDIPPELDAVILRALQRDKKKRFRSLKEFRQALLPFVPRQQDIVGLSLRLAAFLLDYMMFGLLGGMATGLLILLGYLETDENLKALSGAHLLVESMKLLLFILYFIVSEKRYGCTPAKRWLRLRVCQAELAAVPRWSQALVRGLVFYFMCFMLADIYYAFFPITQPPAGITKHEQEMWALQQSLPVIGLTIGGWIALLLPMRRRNGYRGLHEWLSGTRTIRLPGMWAAEKPAVITRQDSLAVLQPEDTPHEVGPYVVHGCHRWEETQQILLGEESSLGRLVWIWRRPDAAPSVPPRRREVSREGRWRWLSSGLEHGWRWDAFLATPGASLPTVIKRIGRIAWPQARTMLHTLSQELTEACADGTLPQELSLSQVWLQANGGVQLLDMNPEPHGSSTATGTDEDRALAFLRQVTVLLLEGRLPIASGPRSIHAALPIPALQLLNRLFGAEGEPLTLTEWHRELTAVLEMAPAVTRTWRMWQFLVQSMAVLFCFGLFEALFRVTATRLLGWQTSPILVLTGLFAFLLLCAAWSFWSRGGWIFRWMGLALCRPDGRLAPRWQCAWRTLLAGAPFVLLMMLREALPAGFKETGGVYGSLVYYSFQVSLFLYFLFLLISAIVRPARGWHDVMAGTYVVPR